MLGFVSEKYESGKEGPGTISDNPDDPGGKSYGSYQFASRSGTLQDYVQAAYSGFDLKEYPIYSEQFDTQWRRVAKEYPAEFKLDQWIYITKTHYLPVAIFAVSEGYKTESQRVQEAIFSIAVQHGGARKILESAKGASDSFGQVVSLYKARAGYVKNLGLTEKLTSALLARYESECVFVLALQD